MGRKRRRDTRSKTRKSSFSSRPKEKERKSLQKSLQNYTLRPAAREVIDEGFEATRRNYDDEQGTQTFCQILNKLASNTNIANIDEVPTVWQLNWVEVAWPSGEAKDFCTNNGERLFPSTFLMDTIGPAPKVRMNEESALKVTQTNSREELLANHAAGNQTFPAMASLKILREVKKESSNGSQLTGSQSEAAKEYVNFTVVAACDQPLNEAPSQSLLELIPFMPELTTDTACILPAPLHLVKACTHYAFQVCMPSGIVMPCQKILTLVKSTKKSQLVEIGQGYKLVTADVEDILAQDIPLAADITQKFVLSSTCTLENLPAYRLDPPRGSAQHALVTITGQVDDVFVADQVQLLNTEEAAQATTSLLKLLQLAIALNTPSVIKRIGTWTENESPSAANKCRTLGRCPTAEPLKDPFT